MEANLNLKAFILGGTGAVGRELVLELVKSNNWNKVTVVTRRQLEEWNNFTKEEKAKLDIIDRENLDSLEDPKQWNLEGYSSVFCCLGSRTKTGKDNFKKVDYTYPIWGAQLASHFKVPHYGLVSAMGADPKSMFFIFKTKGETEEALKKINFQHLSIFRPAQIMERRNDSRPFEDLIGYIPFLPRISAADIAKGLRIEAELQQREPKSQSIITYTNSDLKEIVKTEHYPKS